MKAVFEWLGEDTRDWDIIQLKDKSYIYHSKPEAGIIYTTTYSLRSTPVEDILTDNEKKFLNTLPDFRLITRGKHENEIFEVIFYKSLISGIHRAHLARNEILDILKVQDSYGYIYHLQDV